jgi:diacylglycerol kinase family enzyme
MKVAVVAHAGKTVGGGLPQLRRTLAEAGVEDPLWTEVPKSKRAPAAVEEALGDGAELLIAWGGDGMVRRCVNALKDTDVPLAIVPAGTSNLFATHLGIERDIGEAVEVALHGDRRRLDVGCFDGERFAVMAGAGFDAAMIKGADDLKDRLGRAAYVVGGAAKLNSEPFGAKIKIDGTPWYEGPASCILVAATSASCSAASTSSPTPGPTTASSTSASSPPRARSSWCGRPRAPPSAAPSARRSYG